MAKLAPPGCRLLNPQVRHQLSVEPSASSIVFSGMFVLVVLKFGA